MPKESLKNKIDRDLRSTTMNTNYIWQKRIDTFAVARLHIPLFRVLRVFCITALSLCLSGYNLFMSSTRLMSQNLSYSQLIRNISWKNRHTYSTRWILLLFSCMFFTWSAIEKGRINTYNTLGMDAEQTWYESIFDILSIRRKKKKLKSSTFFHSKWTVVKLIFAFERQQTDKKNKLYS